MDRYCSNCNAAVVQSAVGYLCPDCGQLNHFEHTASAVVPSAIKMDEFLGTDIDNKPKKANPATTSKPKHSKHVKKKSKPKKATLSDLTAKSSRSAEAKQEFVDLTVAPESTPVEQEHRVPTSAAPVPDKVEPKSVRTTMKRLLVPELPAPHFSTAPAGAYNSSLAPVSESPSPNVSKPTTTSHISPMTEAGTLGATVGVAAAASEVAATSTLGEDEIEHGQMIQAELEDTPTTTTIHVIAIILASVLLIAAGVLLYFIAR